MPTGFVIVPVATILTRAFRKAKARASMVKQYVKKLLGKKQTPALAY